jgi:hypothetical protein
MVNSSGIGKNLCPGTEYYTTNLNCARPICAGARLPQGRARPLVSLLKFNILREPYSFTTVNICRIRYANASMRAASNRADAVGLEIDTATPGFNG